MSASETNQIIQAAQDEVAAREDYRRAVPRVPASIPPVTPKRVVGAAIVRGGRVFLCQRKGDDSFPWGWESPGGTVEEGESDLQALCRELREEVGITATFGACRMSEFTFDWKSGPIAYTMYRVLNWEGEPAPREGQPGCGWFDEQQLVAILPHLLPANKKAFRSILDAIAESKL